MVRQNAAVDAALIKIVQEREKRAGEDPNEMCLFDVIMAAEQACGRDDPNNLPDIAIDAAARFIFKAFTEKGKQANDAFAALLTFIDTLPAEPLSAEGVQKLKDTAREAGEQYLFILSMCKASLADADYQYLAEQALEVGRDIRMKTTAE